MPSRRAAPLLPLLAALALALPAGAHPAATSDAQSPPLAHGQSYNDTAQAAGTHTYHCHIHAGMAGTLVVLPDPDPAGPQVRHVAIQDDGNATHLAAMGFRDAASGTNVTTAHLGDTIEWVNEGTLAHNIHVVWPAAQDSGAFELWVGGGLVVALAAIYVAARRV